MRTVFTRGLAVLLAATIVFSGISFIATRDDSIQVVRPDGLMISASLSQRNDRAGRRIRTAAKSRAAAANAPLEAVASEPPEIYSPTEAQDQVLADDVHQAAAKTFLGPPTYDTKGASSRMFWRDGGASFNAIALYTNVCLSRETRLRPCSSRGNSWEAIPEAPNAGTRLLVSDSHGPESVGADTQYYNGTTLLTVRPHGRNIAHAFVEAHWLTLLVLHAYSEGTLSNHLRLSGVDAGAARLRVMHRLGDGFAFGVNKAVNQSSWNVGMLAAAVLRAGLSLDDLVVDPTNKASSVTACFERLIVVGTSRDMCAEASCRRILSKPRDAAFRWINALAPLPALPRRRGLIRIGVYLRENMKTVEARRMLGTREFATCVAAALSNGTVWEDNDEVTSLPLSHEFPFSMPDGGADSREHNHRVEVVALESMPWGWGPQAALFASLDVLIAAAGAANTNAMFMPASSAVMILSPCSMSFLSWMGTTRQPNQDLVTFKLCSKRDKGITFEKPRTGGVRVRCPVLHRVVGGRLKMPFMDALRMMIKQTVNKRHSQ